MVWVTFFFLFYARIAGQSGIVGTMLGLMNILKLNGFVLLAHYLLLPACLYIHYLDCGPASFHIS